MNSIDSSLEEASENLGMNKIEHLDGDACPLSCSILGRLHLVFMTVWLTSAPPCCWARATPCCRFLYNEYMSKRHRPLYGFGACHQNVLLFWSRKSFQKLVMKKRITPPGSLHPLRVPAPRFSASSCIYIVVCLSQMR